MSRASHIQTNFTAGRLGRKMAARVDVDKYQNGCFELDNWVVTPQGAITRRPGMRHVELAKNTSSNRLIPFKFSTTQAYIIEAAGTTLRFYMDHGQIQSGGSPYEIACPYSASHWEDVTWVQSLDSIFLFHTAYQPRVLTRTAHDSWTLSLFDFQDGPYLDINTTATTLAASATSGSVTITASAVTGINGGQGFLATDVGRLIRIKAGAAWGWVKITAVTDTTHVTATVMGTLSGTTGTTNWMLGMWSDTTGWPSCGVFYENRLWFGGTLYSPQVLTASMSGGMYTMMSPTKTDGTITAEYALVYQIRSNDVNAIKHLVAGKVLTVLTASAEFTVTASALNEAITPTNIKVVSESTRGANKARPRKIDSSMLFWQRSGRTLREYVYIFQNDSYSVPDLTIMSDDVSLTGVVDMDYQQDPLNVVWCKRADLQLIALTYIRDQNVIGWHTHTLGGTSAKVRSVAVIPAPSGLADELWCLTERTVNGSTQVAVEYLTEFYDPLDANDKSAFVFMDASAAYDGAPTTTISGLTWLVGETVSILADGAVHPPQVVSPTGTITLRKAASVVQVGLKYKSVFKSIHWEVGGNEGTSQSKIGRIHEIGMRLHNTLGLSVGSDETHLEVIGFRSATDAMDSSPPLFTGDKVVTFDADYDLKRQVYAETDMPYPATILGLMPRMVVYG